MAQFKISKQPKCIQWKIVMFFSILTFLQLVMDQKMDKDNKLNKIISGLIHIFVYHLIFSYLCHIGWHRTSWFLILLPFVLSVMITSFIMGVLVCKKGEIPTDLDKLIKTEPEI